MVDVAGKFKRDHGEIVFNFGDYRGAIATTVPNYLQWMLGKDFPESTLEVARSLLDAAYRTVADEVAEETENERRDEARDVHEDLGSEPPF